MHHLTVLRKQPPAPNISEFALDSTQILSRGLALWAVSERWERRHGGFACCDARLRQGHVMGSRATQNVRVQRTLDHTKGKRGTIIASKRNAKHGGGWKHSGRLEEEPKRRAVPDQTVDGSERTSQWRGGDGSGGRGKTGRSLEQQGEHESGRKIDVDLNANRKGQDIGKQDMTLGHEGREAEAHRSGNSNERQHRMALSLQ
ncbi:hypothetical protein B0H13DRAFT_1909797 [Mycena leptocephala]|nr:hypothetical protein B0H13DRAFT_1909797 [Mycena leptocephala]